MTVTPTKDKRPLSIKVFLVLMRLNLVAPDAGNVRVLASKLTQRAAQDVVDKMPGTWIQKVYATK